MKRITFLSVALLLALGFSSCLKEEPLNNGEKGIGTVTIKLSKPGSATRAEGSSTKTEAPATAVESEVNMIEFFAFDGSNAAATGAYFRKKTNSIAETTTFLVSAGNITFLAAVNGNLFDDQADYDAYSGGKNYDDIKAMIESLALTSANAQTEPITGTGFVMATEGSAPVTAGETNNLTMYLNRVLSKVMAPAYSDNATNEAAVDADLVTDETSMNTLFGVDIGNGEKVEDVKWVFDGYVVINGIKNSYTFRYVGWKDWTAPFLTPDTKADYNKTTYTAADGKAIATVYAGSGADDQFIAAANTKPVYVYENYPSRAQASPNEATIFAQDEVTAFLIKGHFTAKVNDTPDTDSGTRYWRINLIRSDAWNIYRNSVYRVYMKTINTIGWGTPKEAEEDGPIVSPDESSISIDLIINDWDLREETVNL